MAVWLFQANDDYLLVEEVPPLLGKSRTEDWNVRQYWTQLEVGERAILWQSGKEAGVYALGAIAAKPYEKKGEWFVDLLYDRLLKQPILRRDLLEHPSLNKLLVLRMAFGKNPFRVDDEQWRALEKLIGKDDSTGDQAPIGENLQDTDQHEFAEYRQIAHERNFFARNPQLASEAKERDDYTCQICSFNFTAAYGELGKGYAECHHLNPLSERVGAASDKAMTHVDDVTTLCANCHRMVHRTRPALGFDAVKAQFAKQAQIRGGPYSLLPPL